MSRPQRVAEQTADRHGRDPWAVAESLGIPVYRMRLPSRYREVYFDTGAVRAIVICPDASVVETRELLAHGLAHHLLHAGNRLGAGPAGWFHANEREADDFAATLLVPTDRLRAAISSVDAPCLWDLALQFQVSEHMIRRRLRLLGRGQQLVA